MDSSGQEGEKKKKITEVKTFPVPFALEEKKRKYNYYYEHSFQTVQRPNNKPSI